MGGNSTVQRAVDSWHMNEPCPYDLDDEQNKQIQAFMTIYLKNLTNKGKEKEKKPTVLENLEEQLNPKMRKRLSVELGRSIGRSFQYIPFRANSCAACFAKV